jgi:signal transduction histidine kinase
VTFADGIRLVIALIALGGGLVAFAAWREARRTYRMLRTLAAHQLKTPLSAVLSSLYTLHDHGERLTAERRRELLETAIAEAHELDRLVSGFLTLGYEFDEDHRSFRTFRSPLHSLKRRAS